MLEIQKLETQAGDFRLGEIDLAIEQGTYVVLLGPTGSGKSVLIETICGLRDATAGRVRLGGRDVTDLPPRDRHIGYVPQDYALFHTKRVRANVTFGLRARHTSRSEAAARIQPIVEMLQIDHLLDRWPGTLSGGEQQRVALARALATHPDLLLLDEPVSALDEFTRDRVCRELVAMQRRVGISVVHVCHSFEEASLVADRIGVIHDGRLVQTGTPDDLMRFPADRYVAKLLRLGAIYSGRATPAAGGSRIELDGLVLEGPGADGPVEFIIRPWEIHVAGDGDAPGCNTIEGTLTEVSAVGPTIRARLEGPITLPLAVPRQAPESAALVEGESIRVTFDRSAIHILGSGSNGGGGDDGARDDHGGGGRGQPDGDA